MTRTSRDRILWIVVNTCRLLVSATFIFSGLVKLLDPVGMQYKIEDYLIAFGFSVSPENVWPLMAAVTLSLVEFLLGVYLFFGIRRRLTSWSLLIFMALYTPLTLWLAITNGVSDCGCFGDAVRLTNWQTFGKNAILLLMVLVIWWQGQRMTRFISESVQWMISLYSIIVGLLIAGLCIVSEPFIDFRPYYEGQHIPTAMEWPDENFGIMTNHFLRIRYGHYTADAMLAQEMRSRQEAVLARIATRNIAQQPTGIEQEGGVTP